MAGFRRRLSPPLLNISSSPLRLPVTPRSHPGFSHERPAGPCAGDRRRAPAGGAGNAVRLEFPPRMGMPVSEPPGRHSDTTMQLRGVPGLDVDAGLAFVGNSVDVYVRLLKRFVQLHERDVHDMVLQAERADRGSLQKLAHAIKGGAATLGLSAVADLARQLEQAACDNLAEARLVELARALEADHVALSGNLARACGSGSTARRG